MMPLPQDSESLPEPHRQAFTSREIRLAALVESFLSQVRSGGSLDPEPMLRSVEDLRADLEPLLRGILRLERISEDFNESRDDA